MARKDERQEHRDKLEKLFRLLDSPNENEALAALKALKRAVDKPWQDFVSDLAYTRFGDFCRRV